MCRKLTYLSVVVVSLGLACGEVRAGVSYADPPGGWSYIFNGDAAASAVTASLDGTWDHYDAGSGGSDAWDGLPIGSGQPGGVSALVEDVDFLRIQDVFSSDPGFVRLRIGMNSDRGRSHPRRLVPPSVMRVIASFLSSIRIRMCIEGGESHLPGSIQISRFDKGGPCCLRAAATAPAK